MEETKEQTPELRPSGLGGGSDERIERTHETEPEKMEKEDSGFGVSEEGQIPDHDVSDAESDSRVNLKQRQRVSDAERQRRSHETKARTQGRRGAESKMMFHKITQGRHQHVLSSAYGYGSKCRLDRTPLPKVPYRFRGKIECKFFKAGACKRGSDCHFLHQKDRNGAEPVLFNGPSLPMRQGRTRDLRLYDSGRRYETESRSSPEKREKEDVGFGTNQAGRIRDHQDSNEDTILLQQRHRDVGMRKRSRSLSRRASEPRERFEDRGQRRHEKELALFKRARDIRMNCINARGDFPKPRQVNIEGQRKESQDYQDMLLNHNVDAQQNVQEQRKRNIERERTEARLRLEQIRPTVVLDEWSRTIELIKELGLTDFEGSNVNALQDKI